MSKSGAGYQLGDMGDARVGARDFDQRTSSDNALRSAGSNRSYMAAVGSEGLKRQQERMSSTANDAQRSQDRSKKTRASGR